MPLAGTLNSSISTWVKSGTTPFGPQVIFRDDINAAKAVERRAQLLETLNGNDFDKPYLPVNPEKFNRFSFLPSSVAANYKEWPRLVELCAEAPSNGLMEKRGGALIDIDRPDLEERIKMYYDSSISWEALSSLGTGLTKDAAGFVAKTVRTKVQTAEEYQPTRLLRYAFRPFDIRWCYYSTVSPLWNRSRPPLWAQCWEGNSFLLSRMNAAKDPEGPPFYFASVLSDDHLLAPDAAAVALRLRSDRRKNNADGRQGELFNSGTETANLSPAARAYLRTLGIQEPDRDLDAASLIWLHSLAIGFSPAYLTENRDGIRQDWPRIPLPVSRESLIASASLGQKIAALLNVEKSKVSGVTSGKISPALRTIGVISREGGGVLNQNAGEYDLTANWGYADEQGRVTPAKGKVISREYTSAELAALEEQAASIGSTLGEILDCLGRTTCDVYLNKVAHWRNIPANAWEYTIGGYQVIKKWLSYREYKLMQRSLSIEELREVQDMSRRIAAILLLEPVLNSNYVAVKGSTYSWPQPQQDEEVTLASD